MKAERTNLYQTNITQRKNRHGFPFARQTNVLLEQKAPKCRSQDPWKYREQQGWQQGTRPMKRNPRFRAKIINDDHRRVVQNGSHVTS